MNSRQRPNQPMKFRTLRIAWSVGWGLACVLLIMLWIRSYKNDDAVQAPPSSDPLVLRSSKGQLTFWRPHLAAPSEPTKMLIEDEDDLLNGSRRWMFWGFGRVPIHPRSIVLVPHWFPVVFVAALAAIPRRCQLCWRFSLRTLLIATTLVAIVLGLIVWLR